MDVLGAVEQVGRRHQGLAPVRELLTAGASPSSLSRATGSGRLVRVGRGVLARSPLPAAPRHQVTGAGADPDAVLRVRALLLSRPGAVAVGRTAAVLRGWGLLHEPVRHEVAVAHGSRRAAGRGPAASQVRDLRRQDLVVLPGTAALPVQAAEQLVLQAGGRLSLLQAVVLADSALRSGDVDLEQLWRAAARRPGAPGASRLRRVLTLADPASGSVLESVLRVHLLLAGLVGFETQRPLRDVRSGHVLRADFCWSQERLVVETDGAAWHDEPARDRRVDNSLAALGYRVLRYTWAEVVHEPERVVAEIAAALGRSGLHQGRGAA